MAVGGVNSAREQDSSVGGGTGNNCLGVVPHGRRSSSQSTGRSGKRSKEIERHTEKDKARKQRGTNAEPLLMDGMWMGSLQI